MKYLPRNGWWRALLLALAACCLAEAVAFLACRWFDHRHPRDQYEAIIQISPLHDRLGYGRPIPTKYDCRTELERRLRESGLKVTRFETFNDRGNYRTISLVIVTEDGKSTSQTVDGIVRDLATLSYEEDILAYKKRLIAVLEAELKAAVSDVRYTPKIKENIALMLQREKMGPDCGGSLVRGGGNYQPFDSFAAFHRRAFGWQKAGI